MIVIDNLKCDSQDSSSKHTLVIFMILPRQASLLMMHLKWPHESLSGPGADELLHLIIAFKNSSLKKEGHSSRDLLGISSRISKSTLQSCARLKVKWRAYQRLLISRHSQLLYLMASATGRFFFLTQFISFQGPLALFDISWIFWSKNNHLVHLTVFLNCFQSAKLLIVLYFSKSLLQLVFHQLFKCFKILMILEFLSQALSIALANESMIFSTDLVLDRL